MDNRYKLVVNGKKRELFDITADPLEQRDLASERAKIAAKMKTRLEQWQASVEQSLSGADYK